MKRLVFTAVLVGACWLGAYGGPSVREKLDACIGYYEDGEYLKATDSLKAIMPLISDKQMEAEAYKYLGFSYVMLEMVNKAKDFFRVALEKFPQMEVDTLEVPPNITIVFKQAKLERKIESVDTATTLVPTDPRQRRKKVIGSALLASGVLGGGLSGYFFYSSSDEYDQYKAATDNDKIQNHYDNASTSLTTGVILGGFSVAALPVSIVLLIRKDKAGKDESDKDEAEEEPVSIRVVPSGVRLVFSF